MCARSAWARKSGVVSIRTFLPRYCISTEGRSRLSRGSVEAQVAQLQPIVGTPELVPEPSTVMRNASAIRTTQARPPVQQISLLVCQLAYLQWGAVSVPPPARNGSAV